ncbi:hypothetical protein SS1G_09686 [Sclerotinia sclerotiorum 1980 UF-70]|uniref:AAA+ ATPase domain-containing protein n=2 Tax=Sclerotinia sclerotiorum (strain ATCC 18683 / 1980 / Ss-1) TaxID=665079 RepID=A0A1D9PRZ3_SCLS1|nr:hypothetical protein SS1G_09686 [Sclerotinia sclerotiorum 1980 UF-70]APA05292.1 hypothetical protein sscle_01g000620 [Sclerotinia sclerotiorum 1980 UF-70]EDN93819.1 hypothetical protein SS1G_09686 [Sclerotinia sclerotiorum 1980 UF-70]
MNGSVPHNMMGNPGHHAAGDHIGQTPYGYPQPHIVDMFFPGFSLFSTALKNYTAIDLNIYIPILMILGILIFCWQYIETWFWIELDAHFMSSADIRVDDEMYNMVMAWVSEQPFAQRSRRFVANTNLNSRMWFMWQNENEEEVEENDDDFELDEEGNPIPKKASEKEKKVRFTPSFGTYYFWYKRRLLQFRRSQSAPITNSAVSEREEISLSSFGRNPRILKELLDECRQAFIKNDENRTIIYRGGSKSGSFGEPGWTRLVSRISRPFSTVVLDEVVKQKVIADMKDYLHPFTRRWYSNRGIPYRRGYLLHGPPGTGKSSLSFAIAGYFRLKIYIVSLNSGSMNEETLSTLFAELPKQCVVLLEDIDTAGLTHTRDEDNDDDGEEFGPKSPLAKATKALEAMAKKNSNKEESGKISLSALLNVIDGVASQEGRILIMTTNHIEKLDEALIRPGRVDMTVHFDLATKENMEQIFRGIYATLEGDYPEPKGSESGYSASGSLKSGTSRGRSSGSEVSSSGRGMHKKKPASASRERRVQVELDRIIAAEEEQRRVEDEERVAKLAKLFSEKVPEGKFSPAEIQGYLLKHKRSAEDAIEGAERWVKEREEEKERAKLKESEDRERREKERAKLESEIEKLKKEKQEAEKDDEEGGIDKVSNEVETIKEKNEAIKKKVEVFKEEVLDGVEKKIQKMEVGGIKLKGIERANEEKATEELKGEMVEYAESGSQTDPDEILF